MKICCIKTSSIPRKIKDDTDVFTVQYADFIRGNDIDWIERSEAETDKDFQQIIPYVLVKNSDGKFASYTRHGNEKRLHGKLSCGIGGHIDETDKADSFDDTLANGMCRELCEELKDFDRSKVKLSYLGIINEIESDVGEVHLGLVFLMECNDGYIPMPNSELKDMHWKSKEEIRNSETELWTELAFKLLDKVCGEQK